MALLLEFQKAQTETRGKATYITGQFLLGDVVNKNGRSYPTKVLEAAVDAVRGDVKNGRFMGQLGHPDTHTTDPSKISHVITSLDKKGNAWWGKARLIDEGAGKIAKSILDAGASLGVSSRGFGDMREANGHRIVESFNLLAIDLVPNPSTRDAYVKAIVESSHRLPINEQEIALNILRAIPDIGQQLADLQVRNGYDFDGEAGNQFSTDDPRTYLERLEDDKRDILEKLRALQSEIQLTKDDLSRNKLTQYTQALECTKDPFKRNRLRAKIVNEHQALAVKAYTVKLLSRIAKKGGV